MKHFKFSLLLLLIFIFSGLGQQNVVAANVVVTSSADSGTGSLRDAITNANSGDRILFDAALAGQTISLLSELPDVDHALILDGETHNVTISGSTVARSGFLITATGNVTVRNLTFINGAASSGGAFFVVLDGTLSVFNSTFTNNVAASTASSLEKGGAINADGNLQIFDTQFSNNQSDDNGGAVYIDRAELAHIERSTFSDNSALDRGGAVYVNRSAPLTITDTTFDSNTATNRGGALYVARINSLLTVRNSTFKNNSTTSTSLTVNGGGALYVAFSSNDPLTQVENSTFVGNKVEIGKGLAIYNNGNLALNNVTISDSENTNDTDGAFYNDGDVTIRNTIIANTIGTTDCEHRDISFNSISVEDSLVENPDSSCGVSTFSGNIVGSDPLFSALSGSSSFTDYLPLQSGSPAIDEGDDATCAAADQRYVMRTDSACDMGAYEANVTDRCFATHNNGATVFSSADLSSSNVIASAISAAPANGTVKLAGLCLAASPGSPVGIPQLVTIDKNLTLQGGFAVSNWLVSDSAEFPTVIDGRDAVRLIELNDGLAVTIRDLTLQNSKIPINGAAIDAGFNGTVTLRNMLVRHNEVTSSSGRGAGIHNPGRTNIIVIDSTFDGNIASNGGAIYSRESVVQIESSTFANHYANNRGGAIHDVAGSHTIKTSTFFNNIARNNGGAIYMGGTLAIVNSTLSDNAAAIGGGINLPSNASGATITNVTLHRNSASSSGTFGGALHTIGIATVHNSIMSGSPDGLDCVSTGTLTLQFSLVEDGSCNAAAGTNNLTEDPRLFRFDNYGGSTRTYLLLSNSPAIDSGDNGSCPVTDQRGVDRSDGFCDMGAYEEPTAPPTAVRVSEQLAVNSEQWAVVISLLLLVLMTIVVWWFRPKTPTTLTLP